MGRDQNPRNKPRNSKKLRICNKNYALKLKQDEDEEDPKEQNP